jgi:ATP-dependent DNA helicase RecQ
LPRRTGNRPADLDLGYAGRQGPRAPIHAQLAALAAGDPLHWQRDRVSLLLLDAAGHPVGRLSRRAAATWLPRLAQIEAIRIDALLRQDKAHSAPDFADRCKVEPWEVPLVEIRWRVG